MSVLAITIGPAGYVPQTPTALNAQLIQGVTATTPGYTANLPASLVEDISSTDTYALLICDSALGALINSISPYGANPFITSQLGNVYGVEIGADTNTSVLVVFTGTPGFAITKGFTVSDGTYQYVIQDGGIISGSGSSGQSAPLFALATIPGSWAIPSGTVTQLSTSVPTNIDLAVTNPEAGVPSAGAETLVSYHVRVLQAGLAASQGMTRYLKTLVSQVPGVQARLISAQQIVGGGWQIIVGGGDPYAVGNAIFQSLFDISTLSGAVLSVVSFTKAAPGVVTTNINHNFVTGQVATIADSTITAWNGVYTITVLSPTSFSVGVDTSSFATYTGGGLITPVLRNVVVSINDYPDTYSIPYVNPPQQVVTITATWNTTSPNFINPAAISQLATPAIVAYINSIPAGQPINVDELVSAFQAAVSTVLPPQLLTRLVFAVAIDGIGASVVSGSVIILGDPTSYFFSDTGDITVVQG